MFPFECVKYHFEAVIYSISSVFGGTDSFMFLFHYFIHQRVLSWKRLSSVQPDLLICVTLAPHLRCDFQDVLRASSKRLHPPPPAPPRLRWDLMERLACWVLQAPVIYPGSEETTSWRHQNRFHVSVLHQNFKITALTVLFMLTSARSLNCLKR